MRERFQRLPRDQVGADPDLVFCRRPRQGDAVGLIDLRIRIGGLLTEVNVTSPTGIQEINALEGGRLEGKVVDWLESRLAAATTAP